MSKYEFTPYQYSIIRYYHDASTHEFLNIGISLYAPEFKFFKTHISNKYERLSNTFNNFDGSNYREQVNKFLRRFANLEGKLNDKQIKLFDSDEFALEELLRKYLRKESSFRYSKPASGIAESSVLALKETFDRLYFEYVEKYLPIEEKNSRNEAEIWENVFQPKISKINKKVLNYLKPTEILTPQDSLYFEHSWKNEKLHLLQPISFDLVRPGSIIQKAQRHLGVNVLLNNSDELFDLVLLLGKPINKDQAVINSYEKAKDIIKPTGFSYKYKIEIIEENEAEDFASSLVSEIEKEIASS